MARTIDAIIPLVFVHKTALLYYNLALLLVTLYPSKHFSSKELSPFQQFVQKRRGICLCSSSCSWSLLYRLHPYSQSGPEGTHFELESSYDNADW